MFSLFPHGATESKRPSEGVSNVNFTNFSTSFSVNPSSSIFSGTPTYFNQFSTPLAAFSASSGFPVSPETIGARTSASIYDFSA